MNTSTTNTGQPQDILAAHLGRVIEALWLAAAVLTPLAVVPSSVMLLHIEVPKVAVLRALAALIAAAWLAEWMVRPGRPVKWPRRWGLGRPTGWLREDRTRWVFLALAAYLSVNVLSTLTSVSPAASMWGKRPGGDGYSLYSLLCYAVIFMAVATHVRRKAQLWRLLWAIVGTGVVVGGDSILQYHGLDPVLEWRRPVARSYSTLGNPGFAGAYLLMTVTMTLALGFVARLSYRSRWTHVAFSLALAVQVIGMLYTLSRGPWVGLAVGGLVFIGLLWTHFGSRRVFPFGLTVILTVAGSAAVAFAIGQPGTAGTGPAGPTDQVSTTGVAARVLSIYPEITSGGLTGRTRTWKAALELVRDRPWSGVTRPPSPWTGHLLGYGPETFRYVIPLRISPSAAARFAFEAHNVPLHVAVETGVLGLLALAAVAVALLVVGLKNLYGNRDQMPPDLRVLLIGVLATLVGRGVEMMVGIPKVGDLTVLTLLLAMFVGISRVNLSPAAKMAPTLEETSDGPDATSRSEWLWLLTRATIALLAIVALGVFTTVKSIDYVRADALASQAMATFEGGDQRRGVDLMLKATTLAPDVPDYYLLAARQFDELRVAASDADSRLRFARGKYFYSGEAVRARELDALSRAALANAAISLGLLGEQEKLEEAIELSEDVLAMMPRFAVTHYALALAHLRNGDPQQGLLHVEAGDALFHPSEQRKVAAEGAFLRAVGLRLSNKVRPAMEAFERSLELDGRGRYARTAHRHLAELYESLGETQKAAEHRRALDQAR